jgi:hypothetical protein
MLNFCSIVAAILKMATGSNFSMSRIINKFLPVAIFKMATTIPHKFNIVQFQRPELIPDIKQHHYVPKYQFLMMSYNVEFLQYCGGHFENGNR